MKRHFGLLVLAAATACGSDRVTTAAATRLTGRSANAVDPATVSLQYVCENRFRARNLNEFEVPVRWEVVGTTDIGTLTLSARTPGRPFTDTYFDTRDSGLVKLFSEDVLVARRLNEGTPCTTRLLRTLTYPGVVGTAFEPAESYPIGTTVQYSFEAAPGYENPLVVIDDNIVPASGSIVMNKDHTLHVAADVSVQLPGDDDPMVARIRGLLTAADPAEAYQELLEASVSLLSELGYDAGARHLELASIAAIDPVRDSAALRRLDDALAFHEFELGLGGFDGGSGGGGGGGGGGEPTLRAAPSDGQARGRNSLRQKPRLVGMGRPAAVAFTTAQGSGEPTVVLYINGILNTPRAAANVAAKLRQILKDAGDLTTSTTRVRHWYNRTGTVQFSDYLKNRQWCLQDDERWAGWKSIISRIQRWKLCTGDEMSYKISSNDLVEAWKQWNALRGNLTPRTEDADSLSQVLMRLRTENGEHVIVVAHSQGNMMLQQALQLMTQRNTFAPKTDSLCVAAVAVSAPTSRGWPLDSRHLVGIVAPGDAILERGDNHFAQIPTPVSDEAANTIAKLIEIGHSEVVPLAKRDWGVRIHFIDHYFSAAPTREAITGGVARLHRECTLREITLAPRDITLRVQSSQRFTLTATNRNDRVVPINRSIDWSYSPELTRRNRTVTSTVPGAFVVKAKVFDFEGQSTINVPMEALVVTPTQTLHSVWNTSESNAPIGWPMPDPDPTPSWDGDPFKCNASTSVSSYDAVNDRLYVWLLYQHCWFRAAASVEPPTGIRIDQYKFLFHDTFDALWEPESRKATSVTLNDHPSGGEAYATFWGYNRVIVYGYNRAGEVIARGERCIHGECPSP